MTQLFIVSYVTGMVPELSEHIVPVRADNLLQLQIELDSAIKHKAAQKERLVELVDREPRPSYKDREAFGTWAENPIVQDRIKLQQALWGSNKVCGRFFGCLDDLDGVEDMEILTVEQWEEAFDNADAQEDSRRHVANGGKVN